MAPMLAKAIPIAGGACCGLAIVATVGYREESLWQVWAALAVALTTAAGGVFVYGLHRWNELPREGRGVRDAALPLTVLLGGAILAVAYPFLQEDTSGWRGPALVGVALVGAIPVATTMHAVGRNVHEELTNAPTNGARTARLIELGRLLRRRLLPAVGSLVALSTLALGAAVKLHNNRALDAAASTLEPIPTEVTLVFGGMGSLLVALLYVPAASAISHEGETLRDALFSLRDEDEGPRLSELAEKRRRLEELLEINRDVFADLQTGAVVMGPVISGAVGGFLPG